jgi:hypothetical protein
MSEPLPPWLAPSYFLDESDPDIVVLRRADDSFVAAFSARGVTREGILEAAQDDWRQHNPLGEQEEPRAPSEGPPGQALVVDPREKAGWEEFMEMERRALEERKGGQLRSALGRVLAGESQEELDRLAREDEKRAQDGLVELLKEGESLYKHIDDLTPEDRVGRIRAERARRLWLEARLVKKDR